MIDKEHISKYEIFKGLTSEELDKIVSICVEASFSPDDTIIEKADTGSSIYIVLKGEVVVELDTLHKGTTELAILDEGDVFGEISFMENKHRSARVAAKNEVKVIGMDSRKLDELFEKDNHLGYVLMRNLASILSQRLMDISSKFAGGTDWLLRKVLK